MKNKRVAYFNPLINITGKFDSGESFSVEEDTCRENVVGEMWEGIEDNDGATGKGALTIKLTFGVPSEHQRNSNQYINER